MLNQSKSILEEKEQYPFAVNNIKAEYPRDKTIHQLFEEQVSKRPNNVAIVCENEQLTYHELNVKENQLARIFTEKGIGKDTLVGIMMEKSIDLFVGILAVLKAGGAYVPIDIEYPKERIQYILDDSQAKMLLTQKHLAHLIHNIQFNGQIEIFEEDTIKAREGTNLYVPSKSTDLAYVIYTSGTTGNPKGTMLEHKGISNLKVFFESSLNVTEKDRIGQFASISFDASVWEMFMALLTGASLYIILKDTINDFVKFEQYINQQEITVITLPPTYVVHLNPENIFSIKTLVTAGSATSPSLVNKWKDKVTYINAYGPTETTICATTWVALKEIDGHSVPIGAPIQNTQIY
ncbi:gramicidin S non-ribosomal peptide synthetase GrsA, partial [Aneurinibacillus aneurinilyticus]